MAGTVNLPTVDDRLVLTEAPKSALTSGEIEQPYSMLANAMNKLGDASEVVARSAAKQAGLRAVTTDDQGNLQIERAPIVGPASQDYAQAVHMAALVEGEGAARREDIKLRAQFRDNPDAYLKAATAFTQKMQDQYTQQGGPALGLALRKAIEPITTYTYRGLLNEAERLDLQRAEASITAGIASARDDLVALARGGDTSSPAFKAALDKVRTLTEAKVNNPRLAYPRDKADFDLQQLDGDLRANAFLHHIDEVYQNAPNRGEGAAAALKAAQQLRTDPNLKLSEAQREQYYHRAVGEVHANEALRRQDISEARLAYVELQQAAALGGEVKPGDVDKVATAFELAGDHAGAARVYATMARKPLNDDFGRQPLAAQTEQLSAIRGQAAAKQAYDFFVGRGYRPVEAAVIVGNLIHESDLDPRKTHDVDPRTGLPTGIGVAGFRNERMFNLAEYAASKNKPITDLQTQLEFIDRELHSTEAPTLRAMQAAGTVEDANRAFIGYERPRGWTPQMPEAGDNYMRRLALSRQIFTGQGNVATGTPASALWLQVNRANVLDKASHQQFTQIVQDYDKEGIRPSDKVMRDLNAAARAVGDHDLLEKIGAFGDRVAITQQAATMPLPAQAAQLDEMARRGAQGLLSPGQQAVEKDLQRRLTAIQTGLKENPIATTVANFGDRFGAPAPLNLGDDQALAAGLAYRGKIAQFAAQNWGVAPPSALDKADLTAVQAALENPDPAVRARIFAALDQNLPEAVRNATLAKIGEKGPAAMISATAGALQREAPDIAASILRGQQAEQANKGYVPGQGAEHQAFTEHLGELLPPSIFSLAARTDPNGPMAVAAGAIKARYADLSALANDTSGKYNADRLEQAVTDVTGGVLEHNGQKLIAPSRGMTQGQFDMVMAGITDRDLASVSSLAGEPISADYLRQNAQLESIGSGRYLVRLGRDAARPIYAYQNANSEAPSKFVLDLRGRQPAALPYEPVPMSP